MYGRESPQLSWRTSPRRRTAAAGAGGDDAEPSITRRFSTGINYSGLDGSGSSSTEGGFTTVAQGISGHSRSGSYAGHPTSTAGGTTAAAAAAAASERTNRDKVNQIVQAFFGKAAMIIIQMRIPVVTLISPKTQNKKINKWFNLELDETDAFHEELRSWRTGDSFDPRPPPLIIETYLDTSELTPNQTLVILDEEGKRWNVDEAMDAAAARAGLDTGVRRRGRAGGARQEVVLERWKVELSSPYDIINAPELPVVYKKSIVLFRALYTYAGLMPTWKFRRRLSKVKINTSALKVGVRVLNGAEYTPSLKRWDGLQVPLCESDKKVAEDFSFTKVESPAGQFNISVSFRVNCDFRVDDSEALLSSHFINLDEHYFRPSLGSQRPASQPLGYTSSVREGSLPSNPHNPPQRPEYTQAYGSLSTFHQVTGPAGVSPLSALRSAAEIADKQASSASPAERHPMGLRSVQGSRSSLRSMEGAGVQRRPSVSFIQPFKSPSLSASPASTDQVPASPRTSFNRITTPAPGVNRQRTGIGATSPSSYRSSPLPPEPVTSQNPTLISSSSDSPRPQSMNRITSSFGGRRPRISSGASRTEDDNNSSGKASYTSSIAAPGSGLYAEAGASSTMDEDIQIRDFMSMMADGQKHTLKSFQPAGPTAEGSSRRAGNALSKFQKMRDSQSALADSMSSSLLLQPSLSSPSTSSRHLSNVPGMVPSTTFSSSSSPGKPISPHTPHTPAIPSRLSEGLTAQYDHHQRDRHRHHRPRSPPRANSDVTQEMGPVLGTTATTSPLDIPSSPRPFGPRRSNSLSQQRRGDAIEGENSVEFNPLAAFGPDRRQSVSLGSVDMVPLSLSRLLDLQNASETALPGREGAEAEARQDDGDDGLAFGPPRPPMASADGEIPRYHQRIHNRGNYPSTASSGLSSRGRFVARGRGSTPPTGSTSSLERDRASSGAGSEPRPLIAGRRTPSYNRGNCGEDEDLLFAMSDMMVAQQSRRSLEQERGGVESTGSSGRRRSRGGGSSGGGGGVVGDGGRGW